MSRQFHGSCEVIERCREMGNGHRFNEVLLETRLNGRLDLLYTPYQILYFRSSAVVEQRDARACASSVSWWCLSSSK